MTGRTIVITGATAGIGRAFFSLARSKGDVLVPLLRRPEDAEALEADRFIEGDFEDPKGVEKAFAAFDAPVDVFINFAGVMVSKCLTEASADDIMRTMSVNLVSPMVAISQLSDNFTENSVCLLIGSQSAFKGSYDDLYATSKAGIHGLVGTVAPKLAPKTRIIDLAPGITINTRMTENRAADDLEPARQRIPMKRFLQPEEVAKVCYHLISDDFSYMTGNTVDLNGANVIR